jgi:DNA-binding transcriptional LysR family regulator
VINYQHVQAFCAIVAEGSFSRAAASLHLTQPTVSSQIKALEKGLGTRLFERSAQGISLTQTGHAFYTYATQMMELSSRAQESVEQIHGLARGHLNLGASSVPGHYILPRALVCFKREAPGVEVSLTVSNSQEIRAGVHDGRFELGVVGEKARDERLRFEALLTDEMVAVVRPDHPLRARNSVCSAELLEWPLIIRERGSGTRATLERALGKVGIQPERLNVWLELGSSEAVKMAVRYADAVAVLSRWCLVDEEAGGLLRSLPIHGLDLGRKFFLVWRAHGYLSAASEKFIGMVRDGGLAALPSRCPGARSRAPAVV